MTKTKQWDALVSSYKESRIEYPQFKKVTLSIWAFQSEFGNHHLAKDALNFSCIRWNEDLEKIVPGSGKHSYVNPDGKHFDYFSFYSPESFITMFWRNLDKLPFSNWKNLAKNISNEWDFLSTICHSGYVHGTYDHQDWFIKNVIKTYKDNETSLIIF